MHNHSTSPDDAWERQARDELWDAEERRVFYPGNQPPRPHAFPQSLTLLLSRRMYSHLQAVAHDLEMDPDEAALMLLRDTLWRHYHMMQHI